MKFSANKLVADEIRKAALHIDHEHKAKALLVAADAIEAQSRPITSMTDAEILSVKGVGDRTLRRVKNAISRLKPQIEEAESNHPLFSLGILAKSSYRPQGMKVTVKNQSPNCSWKFGSHPDGQSPACLLCKIDRECFMETERKRLSQSDDA